MLETKFKELVHSFLDGEITAVELGWMTDELHSKEKRRDTFCSELEMHIATQKAMSGAPSPCNFENLLKVDLSNIQDYQLRRYLTRKISAGTLPQTPQVEATDALPTTGQLFTAPRFGETWENPQNHSNSREYNWMPAFGIILLVGFFVYMFWFTDEEPQIHPRQSNSQIAQTNRSANTNASDSSLSTLYRLAGFTQQTGDSILIESVEEEEATSEDDDIPVFLRVDIDMETPTGPKSSLILQPSEPRSIFRFMDDDLRGNR